jgi:hypothetical protein
MSKGLYRSCFGPTRNHFLHWVVEGAIFFIDIDVCFRENELAVIIAHAVTVRAI